VQPSLPAAGIPASAAAAAVAAAAVAAAAAAAAAAASATAAGFATVDSTAVVVCAEAAAAATAAAAAAAAADKNGTGNGQQSANAVPSIRSRSNSEISTAAATATTTTVKANGARKRPREVSIVWPRIEYNDYEALVENCVNLRTPRTANMSAITSVLRDRIGIPCNMQDLDALKPVSSTPVTVATVDALEQMIASNSNSGCSDVISVHAEDRRIVPHFPLLIYNIQNYYIPTIFTPDCSANEFDGFGSECASSRLNLCTTCVQHVSAEDIVFIRMKHPTIRSIPVTVVNFTLNGKLAEFCDPKNASTGSPFISYVREDDDYQSVMRRFTTISGDKDGVNKLRIAVISGDHRTYFVPRPRHQPSPAISAAGACENPISPTATIQGVVDSQQEIPQASCADAIAGTGAGEVGVPGPTIAAAVAAVAEFPLWDILVEQYPRCEALSTAKVTIAAANAFPLIGIQRSAADVAPKTRSSRFGGSIKIV